MSTSESRTTRFLRKPSIASKHRKALRQEQKTWFTDVDLDAPGKQVGNVYFPHSPHDDAWGTVPVPIAVIANGDGPTVLLEGGNHGDEYEGPIALGELIRELEPRQVQGRLIFVPALNAPAVEAGSRISPEDSKNMNRSFPGDHGGSMTEQIAAYMNDELIVRSDGFLSLHSGGSSLNIVPSTIVLPNEDAAHFACSIAAAQAFSAPMCVVMNNLGDQRLSVAAAELAGLTCVSTEMAGGGAVTPEALKLCREGIRRVLRHWGVLDDGAEQESPVAPGYFEIRGSSAYVISNESGVFEPVALRGQQVRKGELAGRIHFLASPYKPPVSLYFQVGGTVYATRQYGAVRPGTTCLVVASAHGESFAQEACHAI